MSTVSVLREYQPQIFLVTVAQKRVRQKNYHNVGAEAITQFVKL